MLFVDGCDGYEENGKGKKCGQQKRLAKAKQNHKEMNQRRKVKKKNLHIEREERWSDIEIETKRQKR